MESPDTAAPAPAPPPRRRWRRRLLIGGAAALLVLAVVVLFLPAILSSSLAKPWVLSVAGSSLAAPLEAESISLSWTGEQRVEGVRLGPAPGFLAGEDTLWLKSAALQGGLLGVLASRDRSLHLELTGARLVVHRNADGKLNLDALRTSASGPQRDGDKTQTPREEKPRDGQGPTGGLPEILERVPFEVSLLLKDCSLVCRDDELAAAAEVRDVAATVQARPGKMELDVRGAVADDTGKESGRFELRGLAAAIDASGAATPPRLEADGTVEDIDLRPFAGLVNRFLGLAPPPEVLGGRLEAMTDAGVARVKASLRAESLSAQLGATARLEEPGVPWEATLEAQGRTRTLQGVLGFKLPAGSEIGPDSRVRVASLALAGQAKASKTATLVQTVNGAGRLELDGPLSHQGWTVEQLTAGLRAAAGVVSLEDVAGAVNGGRLTGRQLALDLTTSPPSFRGSLQIEEAAANYEMTPLLSYTVPFLALEGESPLFAGKLSASLEIAGQGFDVPSLEQSLTGKGLLRVREGKLSGSKIFAEASRLLGATFGETLFSELGSDFTIGAGKVEASKVFFLGKEGGKIRNLGLAGFVRLDQRMELGVNLAALQETIGDKKIQRLLRDAVKVLGDKGLPLKLKGTLQRPELALEPSLGALQDGSSLQDVIDIFRQKEPRRERKEKKAKE